MDNQNIVQIRFGVEGGSSIDKNSGLDIKNQLMAIAKQISDQKLLTVKFNVDTEHISKQLKKINLDINSITQNSKIKADGIISTNSITSNTTKEIADNEKIQKQINSKIRSYAKLTANIEEWNQRYGNIISSSKQVKTQLESILSLARQPAAKGVTDLDKQYNELRLTFDKLRNSASRFGAMNLTIGQKLKKALDSKIFNSLSVVMVGVFARAIKQVYQNVVALDRAVTDLQIATGKTREQTKQLISEYSKLAKRLGATTLEVAQSADTWLRQGYSIAEANDLITNSMMLSKLGQIDSAEAAKALTSAMKGYKVAVEDAMGIVDKFTAVDMIAAVSAGDIATAMAETATSANIAGVSMDRLIGYISTVAEVTQDAATSVGTFYKTLFARMGNVKAGVFVDDETGESLNDVEKVLNKLNIQLRNGRGEFRDFGDVLDDVAARWDSFNDVQQKAIATALAGTRQQEKLITLFENYGDALSYAETAANSAGTAQAKYQEAYLDSIEAKLNSLKATWEEFSTSLLDSDIVKKGVEFLSFIANILSKILQIGDGLLVSIPAITVALVAVWAILIKIKTTTIFTTMVTAIKGVLAVFPALIANLKAAYLNHVANTAATKGYSTALIANMEATQAADKAQKAMNATNPLGWIILAVAALYALVKIVDKCTESLKEIKEKAKEAKEAWQEIKNEVSAVEDELKKIRDRIEEINALDKISAFEQDELKKLKAEEEKLKSILLLKQQTAAIAKQEAIETSKKAFEKTKNSQGAGLGKAFVSVITLGISDAFGYGALSDEYKRTGKEKKWYDYVPLLNLFTGVARGTTDTDSQIVNKLLGSPESWEKASGERKQFVANYINDLSNQLEGLEYSDAPELFEELYNYSDKFLLLDQTNGLSELWENLLGRGQFEDAEELLKKLANQFSNVTDLAEALQNLDDTSDASGIIAYLQKLQEEGYLAEEVLEGLPALIAETLRDFRGIWVNKQSYTEILDDLQPGFDTISKALSDISSIGIVSPSNIKDLEALIETSEELKGMFEWVDGIGYKLAEEFAGLSEYEVLKKYTTASLQSYADDLEVAKRKALDLGLSEKQLREGYKISENELKALNLTQEEYDTTINSLIDAEENLNKAMTDAAVLLRSEAIKAETERLNKQKDALDNQLDAYKNLINIRKDLLKSYKKEIDYQEKLAKKQKSVADLETQLALARLDKSEAGKARVRDLESEVKSAKEDLTALTLEYAVDQISSQMDKELQEYETMIKTQTAEIVAAIEGLKDSLMLVNAESLVPKADNTNVERILLQDQLSDAQKDLGDAQTNKTTADTDAYTYGEAQKALDEAKKALDNISGWDKFWKTKKYKNALAEYNAAQSLVDSYDEKKVNATVTSTETALETAKSEMDRIILQLYETGLTKDELIALGVSEEDLERLKKKGFEIHHTGGIVGNNYSLSRKEVPAILEEGEEVLTKLQAARVNSFIKQTSGILEGLGKGMGFVNGNTYNAPLITFECGDISQDTLPELQRMLNSAIDTIKRDFDAGRRRTGYKSTASKFNKS